MVCAGSNKGEHPPRLFRAGCYLWRYRGMSFSQRAWNVCVYALKTAPIRIQGPTSDNGQCNGNVLCRTCLLSRVYMGVSCFDSPCFRGGLLAGMPGVLPATCKNLDSGRKQGMHIRMCVWCIQILYTQACGTFTSLRIFFCCLKNLFSRCDKSCWRAECVSSLSTRIPHSPHAHPTHLVAIQR